MTFKFDPRKSASNKIKHGIDFIEAQALWVEAPREYPLGVNGEMRTLLQANLETVWLKR